MDKITKTVKYFLEKYNIQNNKTPILIAFSGGYDSMCLLDVVSQLNNNIIAIHLNHNWRAEESDQEEINCKEFCKKNNIKFYSEKLSLDTQKTETAAREARYNFFKKCANQFSSDIVLTAHNANDNAETIIYRIAKGTGTKGLNGIAEKRDIFYRPLLSIKRDEIELYCLKNNLSPNNDSSNSNIKYKRNLIRKNILPEFEKINKHSINAINSLSEIAKNEQDIIEEYLSTLKEPYSTKNFIIFSKAVQQKLLYNLITKNNIEYDKTKITKALEFIIENQDSKSGKRLSVGKNIWIFVNNKKIALIEKQDYSQKILEIKECGNYNFENKIFSINETCENPTIYPKDSQLCAFVDLSHYKELTLRHRMSGDIISPLGCGGSQKLKKYLNEKKIPQHEKDSLLFLAYKNEILWAPSLGISEKIKIVTRPTHVLELKIMEK